MYIVAEICKEVAAACGELGDASISNILQHLQKLLLSVWHPNWV